MSILRAFAFKFENAHFLHIPRSRAVRFTTKLSTSHNKTKKLMEDLPFWMYGCGFTIVVFANPGQNARASIAPEKGGMIDY